MSQENVELAKALCPRPDVDVVALFRDEHTFARMAEAFSRFLTEDFQSVVVLAGDTRTAAGVEGLRQHWLDWLAPWATYRTTIEEAIDAGESVVLLLRDYGRREDMDDEVELIGASVLVFKEGKLARWEDYTDRAEALEAVGLSE